MKRSYLRSSAGTAGAVLAALLAATPLAGMLARPAAAQSAQADPDRPEATWAAIRGDIFPSAKITEAGNAVRIDAPGRAEDAALVPLTLALELPKDDPRTLKAVTLIIDENPAPVAGRFAFGDGIRNFSLSVRVRVNSYSWVRAVAETSDGALIMTKAYVKAAGGCSAPATKDTAESIAKLGEIRFRSFADSGRPEAQVQIRHPNFSGLQMDEATRGYTPAWFVREVQVKQGAKLIFAMEGGISISEDPTFRFSFTPSTDPVSVRAEDTEGKIFARTFPGNGS
ncbi:quinoprotein dehydrogenase-associated SoxYZ-like carrier [Xanthobacter sp.]|uniref:quinoprotein dehydrogenase-associated SoxYZ-like carrier n=1 Tax=Xanthobacter sp. TaxID=35809 RepID=UPI0025EDE4D9|nr:quinoprotein dehydrogenase-associated SoxYZ-like carrier [Xanthobacter sp.]